MPRIVTAAALESFEPEYRLRFAALCGDDLARSRCSGIWEDRTCTRRGKIPEVLQLVLVQILLSVWFLSGEWFPRLQAAKTTAHISGAVIAFPVSGLKLN